MNDAVGAMEHCLVRDSVQGPVNVVSPQPVANREFTTVLASVLHRQALLPVPAFILRLALGEMADEALLASARVRPGKLLDSGYCFQAADLRCALEKIKLGRTDDART